MSSSMPQLEVPASLTPPPGAALLLRALGRGVQIYTSQPNAAAAGKFQWVLKGPEASLTCEDERGQFVATHFAGPTWQSALEGDSSKVTGEVAAKADAPGGDSIPWLLLKGKSTDSSGMFSGVKFIQRLRTRGGLAPSEPTEAGREVRVPYEAQYVFYTA